MYVVMHVIYGKPFTPECCEILGDSDPETSGFETFYNEFSDSLQGYCGVQLWEVPCTDGAAAHNRPMVPSLTQQLLAAEKLEELSDVFKEELADHKIGVYFVFSTS